MEKPSGQTSVDAGTPQLCPCCSQGSAPTPCAAGPSPGQRYGQRLGAPRLVSHCHQFAFLAIKETVRNKATLLRWPAQIAYLAVNVYAKSLLVLSSNLSGFEPCLAAQWVSPHIVLPPATDKWFSVPELTCFKLLQVFLHRTAFCSVDLSPLKTSVTLHHWLFLSSSFQCSYLLFGKVGGELSPVWRIPNIRSFISWETASELAQVLWFSPSRKWQITWIASIRKMWGRMKDVLVKENMKVS